MQSSTKLGIKLLPTLLVLMSMLLVACGGSTSTTTTVPSQKAPAAQQVLNMPFSNGISDLKTMDPALSTDAPSIAGIDLVFTGLVQFDNNLKVTAATRIVLRGGIRWPDMDVPSETQLEVQRRYPPDLSGRCLQY